MIFPAEVQYRDYDVERERISATLGLDFRAGDSTELYVKGIWSQFDDQEFRRRLRLDLDEFEDFGPTSVSGSSATFDDTTVNIDGEDTFANASACAATSRTGSSVSASARSLQAVKAIGATGLRNMPSAGPNRRRKKTEASIRLNFASAFPMTGSCWASIIPIHAWPLYSVITDNVGFFDPATYPLNDVELTVLSDSEDEEYSAQFDLGRRFQMDAASSQSSRFQRPLA